MADFDKPIDQQLWRNLGFIRSQTDRQYAIDVLEARRDFLRLRRQEEAAIRQIYVEAANHVASDLRGMKSSIGPLTRSHVTQLEKSMRREAEAIRQAVESQMRHGMTQAVGIAARPLDNHLLRAIQRADAPLDFLRIQRGFADVNTAAVEALWARTHQGLRVSDRIWRSVQKGRETMRDLVQVGVAAGRDTVAIARDLSLYARSGAATLAKDYPNMMARMGRRIPKDQSYEALRLARTEKTKAYTEGTYSRGRVNPSYQGSKWMLSDAHPLRDVCDDLATADLYNMGAGVYPKGQEPVVPHPNCLCFVVAILMETAKFVDDLIAWKQDPASRPYLDEWYNETYVGMGERQPVNIVDPISLNPRISRTAAATTRRVGEQLRVRTMEEGVEFAALVDAQTGTQIGSVLRGVKDGVNVAPHVDAMQAGRAYVQIHTHPGSSSFSPVDARLLVRYEGFTALHVVGRDGTRYFLAKRPGAPLPSAADIDRAYESARAKLMSKYRPQVQSGVIDAAAAWKEHSHEIWLEIASRLQFEYGRWGEHGGQGTT